MAGWTWSISGRRSTWRGTSSMRPIFFREHRVAERPVVVAGGTGLYFRALTQGLCEAPAGPSHLREELAALSVEQLRERLQKVDPQMLVRIDAANPRRLIRAIEVMETTGRSLHAWQEETPVPLVKNFKAVWLQRTREELQGGWRRARRRCSTRVGSTRCAG